MVKSATNVVCVATSIPFQRDRSRSTASVVKIGRAPLPFQFAKVRRSELDPDNYQQPPCCGARCWSQCQPIYQQGTTRLPFKPSRWLEAESNRRRRRCFVCWRRVWCEACGVPLPPPPRPPSARNDAAAPGRVGSAPVRRRQTGCARCRTTCSPTGRSTTPPAACPAASAATLARPGAP